MAKVVVLRARGDNQVVIAESPITQDDAAIGRFDIDDFAQEHFRILLPLQNGPERRGDVRRRESTGGHLVEQWLKEVEIPPIQQRHAHGGAPQPFCRMQAAKAAADDHQCGQSVHVFSKFSRTNYAARASRGCRTRTIREKSRQTAWENHVEHAFKLSAAIRLALSPCLSSGAGAGRFSLALVTPKAYD